MAPLRVLVAGGGITGPALAYWLSKVDCEVTIYEKSPDLRASGQQIDLRGQGITVIKRMGLEKPIREKVVDEEGLQFVDEDGNVKAFFGANKTGKGMQSFTSEFEIMRGDLCRLLYDASKDKVKYLFGTTIETFEDRGQTVHVKFSDGKEGEYDLLVGADGQGSRTRRQLLGQPADAKEQFNFLGLYICYFSIPYIETDINRVTCCLLPGRRAAFTRVDNPKTTQAYMGWMKPAPELEAALSSGDVQKQKRVWADLYRDCGWEVPRILDGMLNSPAADDFYCQKIGQVKIDTWSKGRVVLVGDAGYCPSPITGKGTTVGLVGAYVLAGEIAKQLKKADRENPADAVGPALEGYELALRPFVKECQNLPPGVPGIAYPESRWGIKFTLFVLGLIQFLRIDKLASYFISDEIGKWKLPDYPELQYKNSTA